MSIDKNKIITQDETGEPAEIDQVESRVQAEMELIEARAKQSVADGLQGEEPKEEAKKLDSEPTK